jgi:hypothetical protein
VGLDEGGAAPLDKGSRDWAEDGSTSREKSLPVDE